MDRHRKLFEEIKYRRLPCYLSIWLKSIENGEISSVNKFIKTSLSDFSGFEFNGQSSTMVDIKPYIK